MIKLPCPLVNLSARIICFTGLFLCSAPAGASEVRQENGITVFLGDSAIHVSAFDQKRAELTFLGLLPLGNNQPACVQCHITTYIDTLNWNPTAFDIAAVYSGKKADDLLNAVNSPLGKKMTESHSGYNITDGQAILLQAYLEKLHIQGGPHRKPLMNHLLVFILINLLGIFFTVDLLFTHRIPYRFIHLLVIAVSAIYITKVLVVESIAVGRSQNYEPEQPVKFSHYVHANQNQIACEYCHSTAETSKTAGIPSVNICLNCHTLVREGTRSGKFEINKIIRSYENNAPIEWIKVHNLPDYVFFSHAQHVGAGKITCETCHGDVRNMDRIIQVKDLSMGWCVNCHRDTRVQFSENSFYRQYKELHNKFTGGKIDSVTVADIGGIDCMKCHY
jgi:hypothetical protein